MKQLDKEGIALPALRGMMGQWIYYSCLMNLEELSKRVNFAGEIHNNKNLSDMIQRHLNNARSKQIADYLNTQDERFFNSLVVATYGGEPNWHAISSIHQKNEEQELNSLHESTLASVGFLTFSGSEKMFALDGQHRLAGIKQAVKTGLDQNPFDEVSVIFVGHEATTKGLERTRRLFTTLNKTARPVSKGDIIALDEDDVMAICVRRLIENSKLFSGNRIAFVASNNMPVKNTTSLTTIGNLYDVLSILFTETPWDLKTSKAHLQRVRPDDDSLKQYFNYAKNYFELMQESFAELKTFFSTINSDVVVTKHRGAHGGKVLFRPIGLEIITRVIVQLAKSMPLEEAIKRAAKLPRDLTAPPYKGLMWDDNKRTISNAHKVTLREVLLYMLGDYAKWKDDILLARYRREVGNDTIDLPKRVS